MLPFSVFMIHADGNELCADTLYADGFSAYTQFATAPECFEFDFYIRSERRYEHLAVTDFTLTRLEKGYTRFSTRDAQFITRFRCLQREYLSYINTKLETEECDLLRALTGRGFEGGYSENAREWRKKQLSKPLISLTELPPVELAVNADSPRLWRAFADLSIDDFLALYWEENALTGHPITALTPTHIYIGSMFCPERFPDDSELKNLLAACEASRFTPVICFPPMPERVKDTYLHRANLLPQGCELVINDIGTALMLSKRGFRLTAGPLINKRPKDPRARLRPLNEMDYSMNRETSTDADFYFEYLKSLGFGRLSYEACGWSVRIRENSCLHLPKYLTNLSMMCPLRAAVQNGSRGLQCADAGCPGYCDDNAFMYPDGMGLIGEGNALFGISSNEINDFELLKRLIEGGVTRLIVRS